MFCQHDRFDQTKVSAMRFNEYDYAHISQIGEKLGQERIQLRGSVKTVVAESKLEILSKLTEASGWPAPQDPEHKTLG